MMRRRLLQRAARGFTLVELMVALSGGLFVSIAVFVLAKNATALYQSETRLADATFGAVVGFERLRADIARAGFLSTPNIWTDTNICGGPAQGGAYPPRLGALASVYVEDEPPGLPGVLADNLLAPQRIELAGSFTSSEQFPAGPITANTVTLDPRSPAMYRIGYHDGDPPVAADQANLVRRIFGANRALRIVNKETGRAQFATIAGVAVVAGSPVITVGGVPALQFLDSNPLNCGFHSFQKGALVNVVNIVRYRIGSLDATDPTYGALFDNQAPTDAGRTELIREELDVFGQVIPGTMEIITEFAVDLGFRAIAATQIVARAPGVDQTQVQVLPAGNALEPNFWGNPMVGTNRPDFLRGLRVRLSVRSREADREADIPPLPGGGLLRIGLGPAGGGGQPFARVRTQQADISLRNQLRPRL